MFFEMRSARWFALLLLPFVFIRCASNTKSETRDAEETVRAFFYALRNGDTLTAEKLYPGANQLENISGSDSIQVTSALKSWRNSDVTVTVTNSWHGKRGITTTKSVTLYLSEKSSNYFISETKGLCEWGGSYYDRAMEAGFILAADTTDLRVCKKLKAFASVPAEPVK